MNIVHRPHRCSIQNERHERPFESLRESSQEGEDEDNAGGGLSDKVEDDENAQTDRVANELMENTTLEPSPPPAASVVEEGGRTAVDKDLPQDVDGELGKDTLLDGDPALGGMISPRPAEQGNTDGQIS